jgi:short-subunit dehydrogenase
LNVVVVTGASSGIGRATAFAFARRGVVVVVTARRVEPLAELARECESLGGRALAVPADVTDGAAVEGVARRAVEAFGRVDVWVNNAAVTIFGRLEEAPPDAHRRLVETNLLGCVHGARAALPIFREQGAGILINVSSIVGTMGQPFTSTYTATKWAIRGLSESLRMELADAPGIRVCTVLPGSIDTPLFQHGANYTGRAVKPLSPIVAPERVAAAIVSLARRPRREVVVGWWARLPRLARALSPTLHERLFARQVERGHFEERGAAVAREPRRAGNRGDHAERRLGRRRQRPAAGPAARRRGTRGAGGGRTPAPLERAVKAPGFFAASRAAPKFVPNFDSASASLRALARFLRGRDFPALGVGPSSRMLGRAADRLPHRLREQIYI